MAKFHSLHGRLNKAAMIYRSLKLPACKSSKSRLPSAHWNTNIMWSVPSNFENWSHHCLLPTTTQTSHVISSSRSFTTTPGNPFGQLLYCSNHHKGHDSHENGSLPPTTMEKRKWLDSRCVFTPSSSPTHWPPKSSLTHWICIFAPWLLTLSQTRRRSRNMTQPLQCQNHHSDQRYHLVRCLYAFSGPGRGYFH